MAGSVGASIEQIEAVLKVTGRAHFGADEQLAGALWCSFVRSPVPHARIVRIDSTRALAVPGVRAVITGSDIPSKRWGRRLQDVPVLAIDRVRFIGEKVVAIAAETREAADEAARLVDVEYEELPAVFDAESALRGEVLLHDPDANYEDAPASWGTRPNVQSWVTLDHGDVERAFAEADRVIEHEFRVAPVHQGYIEPHAYAARVDASGGVQIFQPNKMPRRTQELLAPLFDLPVDAVDFTPTFIGGDFGGKGSPMDAPAVIYLAQRTRRPVQYVATYSEDLTAGNPRHSGVIRIKSGLRADGTILARQALVLWDAGAYGGFKPTPTVSVGGHQLVGSYTIPNYRIDVACVYTNSVPRGHARAPGSPQCYFVSESHMDMLAQAIGMDPVEFRLRNREHVNSKQAAVVERAVSASDWATPRQRWHGRGIAVGNHGVGTGFATIRLVLDPTGQVTVETGLPDTGTGALTVLQQVVAETLGLDLWRVRVKTLGTSASPADSGAGGSRVTHVHGRAAHGAAQALLAELARLGRSLGPGPGAVSAEFTYEAERGSAAATGYIAQIAEVQVDPETGQVAIERLTTAHEVGTIINPRMHQGQIEGGIIQGLGFAVMEDLAMVDGRVGATHLGEYKLPSAADVPPLLTELVDSDDGPGPFAAKAIGESSNILTAAAIANAVFDACGARITDLPLTAEKVFRCLHPE
ncbi:MAG: xanthine dehydrogenase family protein molybdopterin-binding subunit [Chloroflexi bacterium]|nr:xanthine dehydrogenase family protein molybdopterin-binding subunit [Chloroflexota bacterium]